MRSTRRTAHAVNSGHLTFVEGFHHQCAQHAGDDLVTEAADGDKDDGDIRLLVKAITASETIKNAPLTDDATTEFTRLSPNRRV